MTENSTETLEIYIAYDQLKAKDLADFLSNLSFIADKIAEDYFSRFNENYTGELPTLDIESIHTGESVKFKLIEGWKLKIGSSDEADIVVSIPKKLGIPLVIGYILIWGANQYLDFRIKLRDLEEKETDIKIEQVELNKAIGASRKNIPESILRYIDNKVPEVKPAVLDTVKSILKNPEITQFKVNGIEIKDHGNKNGSNER